MKKNYKMKMKNNKIIMTNYYSRLKIWKKALSKLIRIMMFFRGTNKTWNQKIDIKIKNQEKLVKNNNKIKWNKKNKILQINFNL